MKKPPRLPASALAASVIAACPGAALAQLAPPIVQNTELSATLSVRHDSNVAHGSAANAAARGLTETDERITPALRFTIARPLGRNGFSLTGETGYDFFRRNSQLNRERIGVNALGRLAAGPCTVDLMPSYSRRQSDLGEIAFLNTPGTASVKNTETIQDYSGVLRCGRAIGFHPTASLGRSIGDNSNSFRRISDYRTTRYGGGIGYTNPVVGDLSLEYNHARTKYPNRPALFGSGSGYTTNRVQLSGSRDIGAILTAHGSLSYIKLTPDLPGAKGFKGSGWSLGLIARATPDLQITADTSRDVFPSLGTDALFQVNRSYALGATYALTRAIQLSLNGAIDRRNYVGTSSTFGPALTDSVQHSATGTVTYAYGPRLSFAIDVGHQTRNANGTIYDYKNTFVALRTSFKL